MNESENNVVRKLCTKLGFPSLAEVLAKVAWRDVQPILVQVMRDRLENKSAHKLLAEYESKFGFYGISDLDQRNLHEFVGWFYSVLPANYQVPELAPITPIGLNALLSRVSQDVSLSSIRASEVVSDPTTPLALHCAYERKKMMSDKDRLYDPVCLATMHRVLRLQLFDRSKGYMQHFRLLGLCSGGRDAGHATFFVEHIVEHISVWLDFVNRLNGHGYVFRNITVKLSDVRVAETLIVHLGLNREVLNRHSLDDGYDFFESNNISFPKEALVIDEIPEESIEIHGLTKLKDSLKSAEDRILKPLCDQYPNIRFSFDFARKAGLGYYEHLCYHIFAETEDGRCVQLADGGSVDWLSKLLSSKKERMVASGFGCELIQNLFKSTS